FCSVLLCSAAHSDGKHNCTVQKQTPSVVLAEGSSTTLSCTYDGSAYSLHWYRQKPGSKPEFLLLIVESSKYVTKADQPHPHMSIRLHDNKSTKQTVIYNKSSYVNQYTVV
uniref:T-cell receptor alpha/delta variable 2.0.2 n=1 Tax=Cyprinus carpio TaxID=7962 RepID=A0A8C1S1N0_CYPCA